MSRRCIFPRRSSVRGAKQPITGPLSSIRMGDEHKELVGRIVAGLFLDMQDEPLSEILIACYVTGMENALSAVKEQSDG